jgi:hypothetical protein
MVPPAASPLPLLDENGLVPRPSNMQELLYNQLWRAYEDGKRRDHDLLDADGKFAGIVRNIVDASLSGFALKLDPRFVRIEKHIERLQRDQTKMEQRLGELQRELDALKAQRAATTGPTPQPPTR